ncbi:unnamed protein product [Microthlaspi erraticum]|uniref:Exostosin GT47 domain-containing protein n=1 Tax=Microthlaspi erraticum TaxID=1685480 RepID=A0A6D2JKC4_9BRAS|nr:unnamed protein product [Microthlaspi erraticum]
MVVSVSKRKSRSSKKTEGPRIFFFCNNLCSLFFRAILYVTLLSVLFFFLIYLWSSFTTLISDKVFHICVFSRKLNDPYCLTAGSKPGSQIQTNLTTKSVLLDKNKEIGSKKSEPSAGVIAGDRDSGDPNNVLRSQDEYFNDDDKVGELGSQTNSTFAGETVGDIVSDQKEYDVLDQETKPKNSDSVLGNQDEEMDSPKNDSSAGDTVEARVSDDPTKNPHGEDKKEYDVLEQEVKPNNLDSGFGGKNGDMGISNNVTFAGETAEDRFSDDPTKILQNEDKKEYDVLEHVDKPKNLDSVLDQEHKSKNLDPVSGNKDGELGSQNYDEISAGVTAGDRVSDDPTKILRSEDKKDYGVLEQEDKPKNLDSVLDQEPEPENKVDLSSLIDLKAEEEYSKYIKPKSEGEENALRAVIKYLYQQRSWVSPGNSSVNKPGSCEGKGVYVYDLPTKFNKDLLVECNDILPGVNLCSYFKNDGFGEVIENLGQGWFGTHMYSLEPILHSRFLKHPCRVYNETQAKLFYVPYYGGFDVLRWHFRNVSDDVKDQLGIEVLKWLESKESWRRNAGKDHVFVLGKITWDFRRDKVPWGSRFLELQELQNPTKLLVERQPWQVNDIAIPHPTYFHPQTDEDISSWQIKIMNKSRRSLVSFAGGARPDDPNSIRSTLIEQCISLSSDDQCRFLDCTNGSCKNPKNVIDLFQDSEFCLQPPGDSATRRSVFDSLITGCIPVVFNPYTAYYQYAWHLPEDHRRYSVFVSEEDVKEKGVNVMEILKTTTLKEKEDMRSYIIHQLLPGLIYGDSNAKFEKFRDAFDITFDSLLEKINKSE